MSLKIDYREVMSRIKSDVDYVAEEAYNKGYEQAKLIWSSKTNEESYQRGLSEGNDIGYKDGVIDGRNEAWEAARKIIRMPEGDLLNIFTECYSAVCTALQVLLKYDASEAIAKLKAYEEKQKADDKIEVGDEVNWLGDYFIVTRIFQPRNMKEQCDGIDDDGCVYHDVLMDDLEKTGRHFDIASILEDMRHD